MKILILILLLVLCSCGRFGYKTFEVTYEDGSTERFVEEHWIYSDGSFQKFSISDGGCVETMYGRYICGVRKISY